jgi:hypothetical protein
LITNDFSGSFSWQGRVREAAGYLAYVLQAAVQENLLRPRVAWVAFHDPTPGRPIPGRMPRDAAVNGSRSDKQIGAVPRLGGR